MESIFIKFFNYSPISTFSIILFFVNISSIYISKCPTDFADLGKEKTFRQDVGFHYFQNNSLVQGYYYFNNLFEIQKNNKVDIENINNDFFYAEISNVSNEGDVSPVMLNFDEAEEEDLRYFKKIEKGDIIQAKEGDILLSKVRPN